MHSWLHLIRFLNELAGLNDYSGEYLLPASKALPVAQIEQIPKYPISIPPRVPIIKAATVPTMARRIEVFFCGLVAGCCVAAEMLAYSCSVSPS